MQVLVNKEATAAFAIYEFVVHSCYFPGYFFVGNEAAVLDIADEMVGRHPFGADFLAVHLFELFICKHDDIYFEIIISILFLQGILAH